MTNYQNPNEKNASFVDLPPVFTTPHQLWGEEVANFLFEKGLQEGKLGFSADPTKPIDEATWNAARESIGNIEIGPISKKGNDQQEGWEEVTQEQVMNAARLFLENPNINPTIHAPVDINWMGFNREGLEDDLREEEIKWINKNIIGINEKGEISENWKLEPLFNVIEHKKSKGLLDKDFRVPITFHASPPTGKDLYVTKRNFIDKNKENIVLLADEKTGKVLYAGSTDDLKNLGFYSKEQLKNHLTQQLYITNKESLANDIKKINEIEAQKNLLSRIYNIVSSKDDLEEKDLTEIINKNSELRNLGIDVENFLEIDKENNKIKIKNKDQLLEKVELTKNFILPSLEKRNIFSLEEKIRDFYKHYDENKLKNFENEIKIYKNENNEKLKERLKEEGKGILKKIKENPFKVKDLEEIALEKASDSIAETALNFYKNPKLRENAFISIETFFPEDFFATGKDMKNLIQKSREKFIERLKKEGISEEKAKKVAEELIGITLDMGHWNLWKSRNPSVDDKWLIKQVREIAPYVKHVHLTDNEGISDTHQEIGTGNVPNKEALEILLKEGNWREKPGTLTIEWGSPSGPKGKQPSNRENWLASVNPYFAKVRTYKMKSETFYSHQKPDSPKGIYNKFVEDYFTSFLK